MKATRADGTVVEVAVVIDTNPGRVLAERRAAARREAYERAVLIATSKDACPNCAETIYDDIRCPRCGSELL